VADAVHSIALGAVQIKPIWIPCLVVALLLVALIVRYRRRALLYVLEQKRREERLEAHHFLQEVALLCEVCCACRYCDMVRWAVFQTLLELASKKGTETGLVPSEVDPSTGDMIFVFTDIMNSTGLLALPFASVRPDWSLRH
jgi:heme exporter protein D